jgi:hypothetical protein
MDQLNVNLTPEMLALVPVVAAIIQVLKRIPVIAKISNWIPFLSVGISLSLCYISGIKDPTVPAIVVGLMSSGGYDLLRAPAK